MIVSADGVATHRTLSLASATMIVSTTGTAYTKRGKVAAVIRFFKRCFRVVKRVVSFTSTEVKREFMATKTGKPTSIDPPVNKFF